MRTEAGQRIVRDLVGSCPTGTAAVLTNVVGREWLSYGVLSAVCPDLIHVEVRGNSDVDGLSRIIELVDRFGSDQLGICYDVANGHMVENVVDGLRLVASRLALIHVSDTTRSAWAHDPIGDGDLSFSDIWEAMTDIGYAGPVVIETLQSDNTAQGFARDLARLRVAGWE